MEENANKSNFRCTDFNSSNKVRGDKNAIYLHFFPYLLNICRKFEFLISEGNLAACLR